jgi:ribosomal protein S18 acetylase RimI-like enzyme
MPELPRIRIATREDLDACVRLVTSHEGGEESEWRDRFEARLDQAHGTIFVAEDAGRVIGYGRVAHQVLAIQAEPSLPVGLYLSGVVVEERHRCRGVGTALCDARIAWASPRSPDLWFFTNLNNDASRRLHRRVGFVELTEFASPDLAGGRGILGHRTC